MLELAFYLVISAAIVALVISILRWASEERGRSRLRAKFDDIVSDIKKSRD